MKATLGERAMFWAILALLVACEGTEETVDTNQATGGSMNAGAGGSMSDGTGGTTSGGAGGSGSCPGPSTATFCASDADCGPSKHCEIGACYPSMCWCSNGNISCTLDCRHICVDGPGAAAGTGGTAADGGAGVSGAAGAGE